MTEETKERDYSKGVTRIVSAIEVLTNPKNSQEVSKVVVKTEVGDITHKPKTRKEEFQNGLKVITQTATLLDDLPKILRDIGQMVSLKGKCVVRASYNVWNTESDGSPVTYRYVQGQKMMEEWAIVDPDSSGEAVTENVE